MSVDRLRVLAVTSLYPNAAQPQSSSFNRQQLGELANHCELELWAPVPWFPLAERLAPRSSAGQVAAVPARDVQGGLAVSHPRTLQVPLLGRPVAGPLYAASLAARLFERRREFDVVLATWAYPDGWAAVALGLMFGLPVVVKVHGTDVNVVAEKPAQRAQLRLVLPRAAAVIAVSRPLAAKVAALGVDPERIHFVPNGVDNQRFYAGERMAARAELGQPESGAIVLYVGNLKREKGVFDLLDAWPDVSGARARLVIVGGGPELAEVKRRSDGDSVTVLGPLPHAEVATWMRACDLLCLPSWNEGTPNVVLEAHASGRPVVATTVGGVPDLITGPSLGRLVAPKQPAALARAISAVLRELPPAAAVTAASECVSWAQSAEQVYRVLAEAAR